MSDNMKIIAKTTPTDPEITGYPAKEEQKTETPAYTTVRTRDEYSGKTVTERWEIVRNAMKTLKSTVFDISTGSDGMGTQRGVRSTERETTTNTGADDVRMYDVDDKMMK